MSGVGHVTLHLIEALQMELENTPHKITLVVSRGKASLLDKYGFRNVDVKELFYGGKILNYLLVRTALPIPVDFFLGRGVYIFPNYKTWYVPFSLGITFVHDVAYLLFPESVEPKNLRYLTKNMSRWLNRADKIITISKSSKAELSHFFPKVEDKVSVVYLGVDRSVYYKRSSKEVKLVLEKYSLEQDFFLYVGNIEPRKNIIKLIEAYENYADQTPDPAALLLVGGDGWKNEGVVDRIEELKIKGYGILRPNRYVEDEDLPALYSAAKATILISLHEGYGLPLVEAQACGSPVIASDLPVFHEILSQPGVWYVSDSDGSIVRAMNEVDKTPDISSKEDQSWNLTAREVIKICDIM